MHSVVAWCWSRPVIFKVYKNVADRIANDPLVCQQSEDDQLITTPDNKLIVTLSVEAMTHTQTNTLVQLSHEHTHNHTRIKPTYLFLTFLPNKVTSRSLSLSELIPSRLVDYLPSN
jgi:hypothetical protein